MIARARDNPFRVDRVLQVRYRFESGDDWDQLLQRLANFGWRAAIVGPQGAGKTTLQEDLADRLAAEGRPIRWLRLNRENRTTAAARVQEALAGSGPDTLLFVDGAEQLGPLLWRRLKRRSLNCGGLVITTHKPGRLPTLIQCRTTPQTLDWIVRHLVPPAELPETALLERLFNRHAGNLRLCLRELYDRWGQSAGISENSM
jgi:adenylate kinase family enzyme